MNQPSKDKIRKAVRESYGAIARSDDAGCGTGGPSCCSTKTPADGVSIGLGYSDSDVTAVPDGANLGLGCGNPQAIADLRPGETVLDLGSGAGFDCFLAARTVGEYGRVIGVDMTPEMVDKARKNMVKAGVDNVEFRLGEIEQIPVADESVDVIISNCVINLSPEKARVFREAFRVLTPGGRLAVSDIVATSELPDAIKGDLDLHTGCMAGAEPITRLESLLTDAGFRDVRIRPLRESRELVGGRRLEDYLVSASIEARKP